MNKQQLIAKVNKMPKPSNTVEISVEEFEAILMNPELTVVEKHFHNHLETSQVLFVIKDDEIDFVAVRHITDEGTTIYKEI
ncbi:cef [Acinetobacter phage Acj61]|uniref:Cef n=1 Tax=Acinetobacter phage Acj61 TaxID=760732 RepID=E5E3Z7_9CAUD|nr:cef modifier of supressor tRNAs [Acinetobacter phage Acj61]ADG35981.1 cef [Acinetobacter phage Acj61]